MKRKNFLGVALLTCGAVSLIFGWPWGSLVGAILALAGVLALRLQPPHAKPPQATPPQATPESNYTHDDPEHLVATIKEMESRGEPVPDDLIGRARRAVESLGEDWFQKYETLISNGRSEVVDLAPFAQTIRAQYGWPADGSVLGHEAASEVTDFVLTRIEHFGGKVSLREAIFMNAMLYDGPDVHYFKERQKRGYPSLFENEAHLEWSPEPGFYEQQLRTRHNNAFFSPQKQCVSRHDVYVARSLDADERAEFLQQWKRCLETIMQGAYIAEASEVMQHLHTMYALLENAASIGADESETVKQIRSSYQTVLAAIYQGLKDNPKATKTLEAAEEARWSGSVVALNPHIRQSMRLSDSSDVIPTMLSQDVETIRTIMKTLTVGGVEGVQNTVREIIAKNPGAREALRSQRQKLNATGLNVHAVE